MFSKILIANRGEIACRVIKTAQRLGIKTVAVYSDADRTALHTRMADEAVYIGAAPSSASYLQYQKVIDAALSTGAQAIHPGYGFLSENADFCKACDAAGIVFIGPPAEAIEAMGSKSAAKTIMGRAGVPLVPGYHGDDQSAEVLHQAAQDMGFPVLLKAVAGGGGKGMREVWQAQDFETALEAASREAISSFSNGDMLVEKLIQTARHVEIQVFCDTQGNAVYLFERDCSVQRRHQKIIEEAPAPGLNEQLRQQMGQAAVRAAQAINYVGAGTVEFLLGEDDEFYFMEMNTRLQVEHPVTEMITGQDLVEWQLRIANNEPLPLAQDQLVCSGHAFEARIYAEDPSNDFLPATGKLAHLQFPQESAHVRIDSGVVQGDEVSIYYDPMIAKLIVWDQNRQRALSRLISALNEVQLVGVRSNTKFLSDLAQHDAFRNAKLHTGFIDQHHDDLFPVTLLATDKVVAVAALAQYLYRVEQNKTQSELSNSPWDEQDNWRPNYQAEWVEGLSVGDQLIEVRIKQQAKGFVVTLEESAFDIAATLNNSELQIQVDGHCFTASLVATQEQGTTQMHLFGDALFGSTRQRSFSYHPQQIDVQDQAASVSAGFLAPMTGTVITVEVNKGDKVQAGDPLVLIEAMKMEHAIKATQDGIVTDVFCAAGELVEGGAELLVVKPLGED